MVAGAGAATARAMINRLAKIRKMLVSNAFEDFIEIKQTCNLRRRDFKLENAILIRAFALVLLRSFRI